MSDDLVAFIAARLDDEHAEALAATPGPWRYNPGKQWLDIENKALRDAAARAGVQGEEFVGAGPLDATIGVAATGPADHPQSMADARFIARHDPSRVLREVAAHRRLLADILAQRHFLNDWEWYGCRALTSAPDQSDVPTERPCSCGRDADVERRLRLLAAIWSDSPGFRFEWLIEENSTDA